MHIEFLYFACYILLSFWLVPKFSFVKNSGLSGTETRSLLAFKIFTAIACAFYFDKIFVTADYVSYNMDGKAQYELLLSDPKLFFTDFRNNMDVYGLGGMLNSSYSFWGYLRFQLLFKFIALLDLVTHGNFYLNSALFSSIVFLGHIAFYRIYIDLYKGQKIKILLACFLLPSLLLYTACVHKDGIVFCSLAVVSFIFYSCLKEKSYLSLKTSLIFILAIITIFLFRNYVLVALFPAMLTAYLCKNLAYQKKWIILGSYVVYALLFFISGLIHHTLSLPEAVIKRKLDFALLPEGRTNIPMRELLPSVQSFVKNLPQVVNHSVFRPYLWEFPGTGVLLAALELFVYQMLLLISIYSFAKKRNIVNLFNIYGFCLFVNMILIIGYTIPNVGAIVRYRSLFWILIITPVACNIQWQNLNFLKKRPSPVL